MKIAFVGSRKFTNRHLVNLAVTLLPLDSTVVSGGAEGPDKWAEIAAVSRGIAVQIFRPVWIDPTTKKYNPRAGFERNRLIVDAAEAVIAFWDGQSRGTANSMLLAEEAKKPCYIIRDTDDGAIVMHTINKILGES